MHFYVIRWFLSLKTRYVHPQLRLVMHLFAKVTGYLCVCLFVPRVSLTAKPIRFFFTVKLLKGPEKFKILNSRLSDKDRNNKSKLENLRLLKPLYKTEKIWNSCKFIFSQCAVFIRERKIGRFLSDINSFSVYLFLAAKLLNDSLCPLMTVQLLFSRL